MLNEADQVLLLNQLCVFTPYGQVKVGRLLGAERKWPVRHFWLTGRSGSQLSQITEGKDFNPPQREGMLLPHLLLEHA